MKCLKYHDTIWISEKILSDYSFCLRAATSLPQAYKPLFFIIIISSSSSSEMQKIQQLIDNLKK